MRNIKVKTLSLVSDEVVGKKIWLRLITAVPNEVNAPFFGERRGQNKARTKPGQNIFISPPKIIRFLHFEGLSCLKFNQQSEFIA